MPPTLVIKLTPKTPVRKTKTQFDYQPEAPDLWFDCYANNETWNGWLEPQFFKSAALDVIDYLKSTGTVVVAEYRPSIDAFVLVWTDDDERAEEHYIGHDIKTANGEIEHVYSIGAGSLTWIEDN